MDKLVETIQEIGIFLIAAQAIIHFAPGTIYTKYMKLIVGIMVLFFFLSPVYQIITGEILSWPSDTADCEINEDRIKTQVLSVKWEEMESYIENQTWKQETVLEQMENEIKSRLNQELYTMYMQSDDDDPGKRTNYKITNVIIRETEPVFLRIVMYGKDSFIRTGDTEWPDQEEMSEDTAVNIDTVRISEVVIGENEKPDDSQGDVQIDAETDTDYERLFADILGLGSDQVEVIIYGADQ